MLDVSSRGREDRAVLGIVDLEKSFGGTKALAGVSFDVARGSIHALLGGNGSGKSTTIKILAGVYEADGGQLELAGERIDASTMTPSRARDAGLHFVHQQQTTFPDLTVAENLSMGRGFETTSVKRVKWRDVHKRAQRVLDRFHIEVDARTRLSELRPASRAMVTIARALQDQEGEHEGVLVLDEPTASLPRTEADFLLAALQRYARDGQTIIYVTHRLEEVLKVADRATVLRDGRVAGTLESSELTHEALVELIMGRKAERAIASIGYDRIQTRGTVLEASGITGGPIRDATFSVGRGEIVGIAGLLGSGRSSLLRMLFGALPMDRGTIEFEGKALNVKSPAAAIKAGIAYVPEDRLEEAAFTDLSITDNLGMTTTSDYFRAGRIRHRAERGDAKRLIDEYLIKVAPVGTATAPVEWE